MERAVRLKNYFIVHALAAFHLMGEIVVDEDAEYLLEKLKAKGVESPVKDQTLWQMVRGKFEVKDRLGRAVKALEERGYLKNARVETGGRPGLVYHLNPKAFG